MKKLIILLLVISATAMSAQNYQYFTAKEGIPKAMEIAKAYLQEDSVELIEIKCIRTGEDSIGRHSLEPLNPYNDTNGTSLFWYYKSCNKMDSCYCFRVIKQDDIFSVDTVFYECQKYWFYIPINPNDIIIDSDSLNKNTEHCYHNIIIEKSKKRLQFFILIYSKAFHFEDPEWYDGDNGYFIEINAKTGDCWDILTAIPKIENEFNDYLIKSNPNTNNIIIESNSDLIHVAELRLYDQVGVLHFADKFNNKSYELSTYNYPSGLYLLQIGYGGNIVTKTVMIVH